MKTTLGTCRPKRNTYKPRPQMMQNATVCTYSHDYEASETFLGLSMTCTPHTQYTTDGKVTLQQRTVMSNEKRADALLCS